MKIIIAGAQAVGNYLASLLGRTGSEDITIIDDDAEALGNLDPDLDLLTFEASPISIKSLRAINAGDAELFIAVTNDQEVNMCACSIAKSLGAKQTVAKVEDYEYAMPKNEDTLRRMGIDSVIYP